MTIDIPLAAVIVAFAVVVCVFAFMLGRIIKYKRAQFSEYIEGHVGTTSDDEREPNNRHNGPFNI